jgi:hypothetical protein
MQSNRLRVELASFPINDYRISKGYLELRMLDPRGRSYPDSRSSWKQLNASDILFISRCKQQSPNGLKTSLVSPRHNPAFRKGEKQHG